MYLGSNSCFSPTFLQILKSSLISAGTRCVLRLEACGANLPPPWSVCRIEEVTDEMRKKSSYPVFFPHFSVNSSQNPWRPPRTPSLSRVYKIVWRRWSPGPIAPATEGRLWASTSRLFTPETFPCQYFDSGTPKLIVLHRLCNCECTKVHI